MPRYVIRIAPEFMQPKGKTTHAGQFVRFYNPDSFAGMGEVSTCASPDDALHFRDEDEAQAFYRQQSRVFPLRPDGKPNRPLTAFSVEFLPLEAARADLNREAEAEEAERSLDPLHLRRRRSEW